MDGDAGIEKGQLAQPVLDGLAIEIDAREGLRRRHKSHLRAAQRLAALARRRRAGDGQRRHRVAALKAHLVRLAAAINAQHQPIGQCVDDRDADAVEAAGNLVGVLVEFPAGVQLGHDHLGRRDALALVDVGGDAAAVVADGARAVGVQDHVDAAGVSRQRLVDGVVDHLIDHVVQARAVVGVADIHARPLAHGVQALEHLDGVGAVLASRVRRSRRLGRRRFRIRSFGRPCRGAAASPAPARPALAL